MRTSQKRAFAEGTSLNFITNWVKYLEFCLYFSLVALPASPLVLMCFAQHVANRVKSVGTVKGAMSAVRKLHLALKLSVTSFEDTAFKWTMQGIQRMSTHISKQAKPITPEILLKIHAKLDFQKIEDAVFWLVCLLAFYLLFRKSNLLPTTTRGFNPSKQLKWSDIVNTGKYLVVGIRWSKTDQFGRELKTYPLPIIPTSPLCPYKAMLTVMRLTSPSPEGHVGALQPGKSLTYNQFQTRLRGVLAEVVDEPQAFSSHSFRRGGGHFCLCLWGPPGDN